MSAEPQPSGPIAIPGHPTEIAGRYRVKKRLGEGGMGVVYECEHVLSKKRLAVKVLFPHLCHGAQAIERFRREVSAAAEIDHPGIVQVFDAGVDSDGSFYMAMELLEGQSLAERMRTKWPSTYETVDLIRQILAPLGRAHERGFVHRDIKPENLFVTKDPATGRDVMKILDFGLAREVQRKGPTLTGITFGTPEYMSPEQSLSAKKAGLPSDVWAIGVLFYELLSGFYPFDGETPNAVMVAAIKEPHVPLTERAPHVPQAVADLVESCLEKEAEKRPADARVVAQRLETVLADVTLADTRPARTHVDVARERDAAEASEPALVEAPLPVVRKDPKLRREGERGITTQPLRPAATDPSATMRRLALIAAICAALALTAGVVLAVHHAMSTPPVVATALVAPPPAPSAPPVAAPAPVAEVAAPTVVEPEVEEPALGTVETEAAIAPALGRTGRRTGASGEGEPAPEASSTELTEAEYAEAQACIARGEATCAITILRRSPRATDLARVVDLYESLGRTTEALGAMRTFVRRFPHASASDRFRETLSRHGM